jgi:hypothetical protein
VGARHRSGTARRSSRVAAVASRLRSWCWSCSGRGGLRSWRHKERDRRCLFAFPVGGNTKWVLCLAALLESDFLPLNHCAPPILGMGHLIGMLLETV